MKVSMIIPYYGDRRKQLERSLPFLENQTYSDYEIILVDDGAYGGLPELGEKFKLITLRGAKAPIRSPNTSLLAALDACDGDFIIASQPELLIPYDAIEKMLELAVMDRRNVATQYYLTTPQTHQLSKIIGWQTDFEKIKSVPEFMETMSPWGYANLRAHTYRNHFSFSGSTRERFEEYRLPATEEWNMEDAWVHVKELDAGEPAVPVEIEVYHQEHTRIYGNRPEYSVRIQRIRQSLI